MCVFQFKHLRKKIGKKITITTNTILCFEDIFFNYFANFEEDIKIVLKAKMKRMI